MRLALSFALIFGSALSTLHAQSRSWELKSPDGAIAVRVFFLDKSGLRFVVKHNGQEVIEESILGVVANGVDYSSQCDNVSASRATVVRDKYEMLQGKRSQMVYEANEQSFKVSKAENAVTATFRVSNDAVAFRYSFPDGKSAPITVTHDKTIFNLPADAKGFLQPMSVAKSGWSRVNPCYEEHYQSELPVAAKSPLNNGWVYPALFRHGEKWILISEAGLSKDYCATHLGDGNDRGEFPVVFPQPEEKFPGGGLLP